MIKKLRYLCTLLLLAVVSGAWAEEVVYYTLDTSLEANKGTNNSYAAAGDVTIDGITWNVYGNLTMMPWRIGGKSLTAVDRTAQTKTPVTNSTTKVVLTLGTATLTVNSVKLTVANDVNFSTIVDEITITSPTASSDLTFNPTTGTEWASGAYFKFTFNVTTSGSSNQYVQFSKVQFYTESSSTPSSGEFSDASKTLTVGTTDYANTLTTNPAGLTGITYSSDDEGVATVNASTGLVSTIAPGKTTIKALWEAQTVDGTDYMAGSATYTLYVANAIEDGVFDFTNYQDYGSGMTVGQSGSTDTEFTAGNVTLTAKTNFSWYAGTENTLRIYANGSATISVPDGMVITKIVFTGSGLTGGTIGGSTPSSDEATEFTWTGSSQSVEIVRSSATMAFKTITVTYGEGTAKADAELSFPETTFTAELGGENEFPTLSNPHELSITYSSSNEDVATIDTDGVITLLTAGTTTITATSDETDDYNADEASYTLTVVDPNVPGSTAENPYTVAQARAAIDGNTGVTGVYAKGIVSEIVTAYNSQFGNISYNISDDGTTDADQLQAYRGKSYEGAAFTSADDIRVGDKVVVYGNLTNYNGTYEFVANNQLVSLERDVVKTDAELSYSATEFTAMLGEENTFPELDNPNEFEVTYSSSNEEVATIDAEGKVTLVATGTTTIKATTEETDEFYAGEASYILTVVDPSLVSGVIDLRGKTGPLTFEAPLNGFIKGSGYNSYESVSLTGDDGVEYMGWSATDVMTGNSNCLQLKANSGKLVSPNVLSDKGVKIEVTASTNTGAIVIGDETENESFTTALTETNFEVTGADGKYAIISKIVITPLTESPKAKPELTAEDMVLNIGDEEPLSVVTNSTGSLTFASDNEEVAEVVEDVTAVIVRALAVGTATITVSLAETEEYEAAETTFTVTVKDPNALEAMYNFDDDYSTLFPTLEGVSSGSGDDYVSDGDITEAVTAVVDGIQLTVSAADEEANNPNRIWATSPRLRMYSGTLTVAAPAGYMITGLEFNDKIKWNEGNTANTGTLTNAGWTGEAQSVVITIAGNTQWKYINVLYKRSDVLIGDVNGDEKVDVADVTALVNIIVKGVEPTDAQKTAGNLDPDEGLTVNDVKALVEKILTDSNQ